MLVRIMVSDGWGVGVVGMAPGDGEASDGVTRLDATKMSLRSFMSRWAVKSLWWRNIRGDVVLD